MVFELVIIATPMTTLLETAKQGAAIYRNMQIIGWSSMKRPKQGKGNQNMQEGNYSETGAS